MANSDWLTIAEAARLSGHTQPLIAAILNGSSYKGRAAKNSAGHWRIEPTDFSRLLAELATPSDLPRTIEDVRSGPRID